MTVPFVAQHEERPPFTIFAVVLVAFESVDHIVTSSEAEAVAWAQERATKVVSQVTLTASAGDPQTFAYRHIAHDRDSGWRGWKAGEFVGSVELTELFEVVSS